MCVTSWDSESSTGLSQRLSSVNRTHANTNIFNSCFQKNTQDCSNVLLLQAWCPPLWHQTSYVKVLKILQYKWLNFLLHWVFPTERTITYDIVTLCTTVGVKKPDPNSFAVNLLNVHQFLAISLTNTLLHIHCQICSKRILTISQNLMKLWPEKFDLVNSVP